MKEPISESHFVCFRWNESDRVNESQQINIVRLFPNIRKILLNVQCTCGGRELWIIDKFGNNFLHFYFQQIAEEDLKQTTCEIIPSLYFIQVNEFCANETSISFTKGFKTVVTNNQDFLDSRLNIEYNLDIYLIFKTCIPFVFYFDCHKNVKDLVMH